MSRDGRILVDFLPAGLDGSPSSNPFTPAQAVAFPPVNPFSIPIPSITHGITSKQFLEKLAVTDNISNLNLSVQEVKLVYIGGSTVTIDTNAVTEAKDFEEEVGPYTNDDGTHTHELILNHHHKFFDNFGSTAEAGADDWTETAIAGAHGGSPPDLTNDGHHKHGFTVPELKVKGQVYEIAIPGEAKLQSAGDPYMLVWRDGLFVGVYSVGADIPSDPNKVLVVKSIVVFSQDVTILPES